MQDCQAFEPVRLTQSYLTSLKVEENGDFGQKEPPRGENLQNASKLKNKGPLWAQWITKLWNWLA